MNILFKYYVNKSDIRELLGGVRWDAVTRVFAECKRLENDQLNIRPDKVPAQLVFKVLNINYSFVLKQYRESQIKEEK